MSKKLGDFEVTDEPYGTILFSAPEVLLKNPYTETDRYMELGSINL